MLNLCFPALTSQNAFLEKNQLNTPTKPDTPCYSIVYLTCKKSHWDHRGESVQSTKYMEHSLQFSQIISAVENCSTQDCIQGNWDRTEMLLFHIANVMFQCSEHQTSFHFNCFEQKWKSQVDCISQNPSPDTTRGK